MRWSVLSTTLDLRPLRRFWPAALALGLFIALAATAQFITMPRHYTASQQLRVGVLAIPAVADSSQVADAGAVARTLTSSDVLAAPQLAGAIRAHFSAAERARQHMSLSALAASLSATHSEGSIVLSVLWKSPAGANEILAAAVDVLQNDTAVRAALAPSTISARLETEAPVLSAMRAPDEEAAAATTLLIRLLLGLVAAVLLPYALAVVWPAGAVGSPISNVPVVEGSRSETSRG
jgi:hypothetical protein